MVKTNFGQVGLDVDDYINFLFGGTVYVYPTRKGDINVSSILPAFFESAQKQLEALLSPLPDSKEGDSTYHLLSHGQTFTNELGLLTGWSGSMLNPKGKKLAEEQRAGFNPEQYYLRFCSDLPRAIQHVLLLMNPAERVISELERISVQINEEIDGNTVKQGEVIVKPGNFYNVRAYQDLMKLAIDNRVIPTPLLRAQYYGPMELRPEVVNEENRDQVIENMLAEQRVAYVILGKPFDEDLTRYKVTRFVNDLIQRKDVLFAIRDNKGEYVGENRLDLLSRMSKFYDSISRVSGGRKILVVTSSGCFDVSKTYFRYLDNPGKRSDAILENEPKRKVRGKELIVKFGRYTDNDGRERIGYLNDPKPLQEIVEGSKSIANFRALSHDDKIKKGNGIVEAEFFALTRNTRENKDEERPVSIDELLSGNEPVLMLGNCGLGKTTFSLYVSTKLMPSSDKSGEYTGLNKDGKYIPVLLRLRKVEDIADEQPDTEKRTSIMEGLLGDKVMTLPDRWLKEYIQEGYKFVFVLDGYDELRSESYRKVVDGFAKKISALGHKVIVTSRVGGFERYEDRNSGYRTINIDPKAIVKKLDQYLESRIKDETKRAEFKKFLMKQSDEINQNWLMVSILTNLYNEPSSKMDLSGETTPQKVIHDGIELYVWRHGLERNPSISKGTTVAEYETSKKNYLETCMPSIRLIGTYMTVTDQSFVSSKEAQLILDDRWNLQTEMLMRQGKRQDRFIIDGEYQQGLRASNIHLAR